MHYMFRIVMLHTVTIHLSPLFAQCIQTTKRAILRGLSPQMEPLGDLAPVIDGCVVYICFWNLCLPLSKRRLWYQAPCLSARSLRVYSPSPICYQIHLPDYTSMCRRVWMPLLVIWRDLIIPAGRSRKYDIHGVDPGLLSSLAHLEPHVFFCPFEPLFHSEHSL